MKRHFLKRVLMMLVAASIIAPSFVVSAVPVMACDDYDDYDDDDYDDYDFDFDYTPQESQSNEINADINVDWEPQSNDFDESKIENFVESIQEEKVTVNVIPKEEEEDEFIEEDDEDEDFEEDEYIDDNETDDIDESSFEPDSAIKNIVDQNLGKSEKADIEIPMSINGWEAPKKKEDKSFTAPVVNEVEKLDPYKQRNKMIDKIFEEGSEDGLTTMKDEMAKEAFKSLNDMVTPKPSFYKFYRLGLNITRDIGEFKNCDSVKDVLKNAGKLVEDVADTAVSYIPGGQIIKLGKNLIKGIFKGKENEEVLAERRRVEEARKNGQIGSIEKNIRNLYKMRIELNDKTLLDEFGLNKDKDKNKDAGSGSIFGFFKRVKEMGGK